MTDFYSIEDLIQKSGFNSDRKNPLTRGSLNAHLSSTDFGFEPN